MLVPVVQVGGVRMPVDNGFMGVQVTVLPADGRFVRMGMVAILVAVLVLVR